MFMQLDDEAEDYALVLDARVDSDVALVLQWLDTHDTDSMTVEQFLDLIGTESSGNHGHAGRPGQVGGSAPSGSHVDVRTSTSELQDTDRGGGRVALRKATADDAERVAKLQVPPAYRHTAHISDDPEADLQATWTDDAGRTQYRHHAKYTAKQAAEKFARLKAFNEVLPDLRKQIARDMHDDGLTERERDTAIVMHLIDQTGFRPGSDNETGAKKKAYGATTLRAGHVTKIEGDKISFRFPSKSGQITAKTITNPALAKILREKKAAGGRLFKASEDDVLAYLKERAGDFKTKDFRTWNGTNHALKVMAKMSPPRSDADFVKKQKEVAKSVAKHLGNTPAIALKSYIDPSVWSSWKAKKKS